MAEAALTNGSSPGSPGDIGIATTSALVTYLKLEADLADEKAKRLRAQAAALSERFGITDAMQTQYELDPEELPPVDENGVPKYKGKKRGRKPKPRKRQQNPNRRKRQHTAYTLFVQETYPNVKAQNPELPSKELISMVAKQWNEGLSAEEKREWKMRAKATHDEDELTENSTEVATGRGEHHVSAVAINGVGEDEATAAADAVYQQTVASMEDDEDDEVEVEVEDEDEEEIDDEEDEEEDEEPPPPKRRRGRPKKARD